MAAPHIAVLPLALNVLPIIFGMDAFRASLAEGRPLGECLSIIPPNSYS